MAKILDEEDKSLEKRLLKNINNLAGSMAEVDYISKPKPVTHYMPDDEEEQDIAAHAAYQLEQQDNYKITVATNEQGNIIAHAVQLTEQE